MKWITAIQCSICMGACVYDGTQEKMFCVVWGVATIMYFIKFNEEKKL